MTAGVAEQPRLCRAAASVLARAKPQSTVDGTGWTCKGVCCASVSSPESQCRTGRSARIASAPIPLEWHRMSQCQRRATLRLEYMPTIGCRGDTPPKRNCQRGSFARPRISSRLPSQPAPRIRRASSRLRGSDASECKAKLMASRLVAKQYRRMTAAQASSSTSTLMRAMHQSCTTRAPDACSGRATCSVQF